MIILSNWHLNIIYIHWPRPRKLSTLVRQLLLFIYLFCNQQQSMERSLIGQSANRKLSVQSWTGYLSLLTFRLYQSAGDILREEVEGMNELEDGEGCYKVLSPGHDTPTAVMNSQELWLPTQDLYKIKPTEMLGGKMVPRVHPNLKSYWWWASGEVVSVHSLVRMHYVQLLLGLYLKKKHEVVTRPY